MSTPDEILKQMDTLLNQLIKTAETMQRLSRQVISEEELGPLQRSQENLVQRLTLLDESFQKASKGSSSPSSALRAAITHKLERFQTLNAGFIENLKTGQKVVEVEAPSPKKRK
jgi:hypothetical protein